MIWVMLCVCDLADDSDLADDCDSGGNSDLGP